MDKITIEFYLYINKLSQFINQIVLKLGKQEAKMVQKIELHEDIFYTQFEASRKILSDEIKYIYTINGEKEIETQEIKRNLQQFAIQKQDSSFSVMIFDTPQAFYEKKSSIFTSSVEKIILKQIDITNSLQMFLQQDSTIDQIKGLFKFIKTMRFEKSLQQLNLKLYRNMKDELALNKDLEQYFKKLKILDRFYKQEFYQEIFQDLSNLYKQKNINYDKIKIEEKEEVENLYRRFSFSDWLNEFFEQNGVLTQEIIIQGLHQKLEESTLQILKNIQIEKLVKFKHQNELLNQNKVSLIQSYWIKHFELVDKNEKFEFLIKNSDLISESFSSSSTSSTPEFQNFISNFFSFTTQSEYLFKIFLNGMQQFVDKFDKNGDLIKQYFTETIFSRLSEKIQVSLFISLYEKKIVLNINLQQMIFQVSGSQISIESITKVFSLLISEYPKLIYIQPLYNTFKYQCKQLNAQESHKAIKYKIQLLSIAQKQLQILQNQNEDNSQEQLQQMENNQQKEINNINEDSIIQLSNQMDEIIIQKLVSISPEQFFDLVGSLSQPEEFQILEKLMKIITKQQLESIKNSDHKFLDQYKKLCECYNKFTKQNEKSIIKIYIDEFENNALSRYQQLKQINNHFLNEFTFQFLSLNLSQNFNNQVLQDLGQLNIQDFDIQATENLFNSSVFKKIFVWFEINLQIKYDVIKSNILKQIETYRQERQKLIKFFDKTKPYLEEDYQQFQNQFKTNQILSQLIQTMNQFKHLQHMYELLNMLQSSVIFNKIYMQVEDIVGKQMKKTQNTLKIIFDTIKQNLIQFVQSLVQNERNTQILNEFIFSNNNQNISQLDSVVIIQSIQQNNNYEIFKGNTITFNQLNNFCGPTFQECFKNVKYIFDQLHVDYSPQLIEQMLKKVYLAQFFFDYGSVFLNLSGIYKVDLTSRQSLTLKLQLDNLLKINKLQDMSIQKIISQHDNNWLQELQSLFLGEDSFEEQVKLLLKLEVILQYKNNNLKLSSFLDLRDLVDEDSTDVISLLIKLNNYNNLFCMIQEFKDAMQQKPLLQFIKEIFNFIKQYMNGPQLIMDLNDCINDFDKIQNISQTFDKKKQFISLTCEIIEEGQFNLVFDENSSDIVVKVFCKKEYSELEMRQVCSKIILEQTTKTNNLIAAAQANIQKQDNNQNSRQKNNTFQSARDVHFMNTFSNLRGLNIQDDSNIQIQRQQSQYDEELERQIQKLKLQMQKFREQWFEIEQIKEILLNLMKYGCYEFLNFNLSYDNRNGKYNSTYNKMKEDVQSYKKILSNWQSQIKLIFMQYPQLTLIGFSHFRQIMKYSSRQIQSFSDDLKEIFKQMGVEEKEFSQMNLHSAQDNIKSIIETGNFLSKKFLTIQNNQQTGKICQVKCQDSQIIEILIQRIKQSAYPIQYYQCFYYDTYSTIQDLELFIYRFQYLSTNPNGNEYFIILNKKLDMKFSIQINDILQKLYLQPEKGQNSLYILANKDIIEEEIIIIPYLSVDQILEPEKKLLDYSSIQFKNAQKYVNFIYSDYPGAGKSFQIHKNQGLIRVPTNGSNCKKDFIQLIRGKLNSKNTNAQYSIHLDMYEMPELDLNYLLFELIFLNSLSIHSKKYVYVGNQVYYLVEIQNSLNHEFFNKLNIKKYFNQKKIDFNIQEYQIQHPDLSKEECVNQFQCYKYLQVLQANQRYQNYLDKTNLENQNFKSNDQSYKNDFQNLLQTWFISKIQQQNIQPCFYKLSHFVKLFGSEMNKFEKCYFVQFGILHQNSPDLLQLGLRTYIVNTSYNLCLAVSVNKINKSNFIEGSNLSKAQQLHNKAQSIEKFNSNMMNFVTFQEQENPCITTFFDKQQQVPKCISQLFELQKENMIFFDQKNRPEQLLKWLIMLIHQNVSNMYGDPNSVEFSNILHDDLQKLVQRITIQKDNFFKIAMIFMRIRSNTPVIIMVIYLIFQRFINLYLIQYFIINCFLNKQGQSGIGKTALIELMSLIMDATFITMNIHAGITERDVINKINDIQSNYNSSQKIILFFDEVNTNKLIGGLFKEILVDRCIKGQKIKNNIIPIAAINPYKLKSQKQQQMIDLQIHGGIKKDIVNKIKNTDLEYMVEPIPESMYNFIWNFDSLDKQDEINYITQMLIIMNQIKLKKRVYQTYKFTSKQLQKISETVFFAQEIIRQEMGYQSACSLRDVSRFNKLLFWFVKNLQTFQSFGLKILSITDYAICLSFYINYAVRLPLVEQRQKFLTDCSQKLEIKYDYMYKIMDDVLTYLTDQTEVPQGIVKNTALKSNIFTLFVCIMNKIPIVLIGPPGCSKSLSISILVKTMKGEQSKSKFFKKYKTLMQLFYQGHIQSTSERIQEVFDNAIQKQNKIIEQKQSKKYLSLVQIEEIGLAEISPHNPLKVLHSVLEKPKISVACISNWPLDQSKMNRMLAVYRLNVNLRELKETIECIQNQMIEKEKDVFVKERLQKNALSQKNMEDISTIYLKYLDLLKKIESGKYEQFHGLRDFYSMSKLICYKQIYIIQKDLYDNNKKMTNQEQLFERIIISFARHFSGLKESKQLVRQAAEAVFPVNQSSEIFKNMLSDLNLIDENLDEETAHYMSRNLMIITENPQFATDYISRRLTALKRPYKLLLGGNFSQDQSQENSYSIINQIISCVESGIIVVLQNLDNIYQSLYELLNQNFRELNGKPYCKISFGADSSNIQIGKGFKLILIQQKSQIHRMDGPLLNRFEKHIFDEGMTLDQKGKNINLEVQEYFKQIAEQFTFKNIQDAIQTLVIQQRELNKQSEDMNQSLESDQIIQILYRLIPLSKSLNYINEKDKIFKKKFFETKQYFSFEQFIKRRILDDYNRVENYSNLITIYSPTFCVFNQQPNIKLRIQSQEVESQQNLVDTLNQFFKQELDSYNNKQSQFDEKSAKIILVVTDMLTDSYDRLILVRQKISEAFIFMQKQLPQIVSKNYYALMTVKTPDQFNVLPFQSIWEQYYLEDLFPLYFIPPKYFQLKDQFNVQMLLEKSSENLLNMVNLKDFIDYFFCVQENITNSYTLIQYKQINRENYRTKRLSQLWEILKNNQLTQLVSLIMQIVHARIRDRLEALGIKTVDDFLQKYIIQKKYIQQTQSLSKAFWLGLNEIAQQGFALVIYVLEKHNLLYMIYDQSNNSQAIKVINNKLFQIFDLNIKHFDALTGVYQQEIKFNQFQNSNRFEIDSDKLDLQFYESEKIYSIINSNLSNIDLSVNGITQNEQQETSKLNKFKETCLQVLKSLRELCQKSDLDACAVLQEQFLNDFYKYLKQNITQYQKNILVYLLQSPQLNFKEKKNDMEQIIKHTCFCYFYNSDLVKIENTLSQFEAFLCVQDILQEYTKQFNDQANIRHFLKYLVRKIYNSIQPSKQVFQTVKLNKIDFEQLISQLVQFIDLYQLQAMQDDILQIKQQLLLLSCFIQEIVKGLSVNLKILNFINLEFFQNLEETYLSDLKIQLKNLYQLDLNLQSQILNVGEVEYPEDMFEENNQKIDFDLKWNKFLLELIYSSIKCRDRQYSPDFTRQLFKIFDQIESFYMYNKLECPTDILIKFNLIMNELCFSIKSEEMLITIFQSDIKEKLINSKSTEYRYMVIFSNAIQQNIVKNSITSISSSSFLSSILYNSQLKNLTQMQKLIYIAIFRHVVQHLIGLINKNVKPQPNTIDQDLKQYFTNMKDQILQLYIAKAFYNQYKQGDVMQKKMDLSPYLKDCFWLKQYTQAFKGLLSSSFLSEVQMQQYKEYFENKNDQLKNILKSYLEKNFKQSQNVFGNIFDGKLKLTSYYPFMMNNNIYLFHRDSQNNTQLYQCNNCKEYIFSNACPQLQSSSPCQQCGKLIKLGNINTLQVLKEANKNTGQLESIKTNNQWTGFYIRLEDDMPNFKLDQGTNLDLRIFALLYYISMLLAFQVNKKYNSSVNMQVYNLKQQREITVQTREINRNLRIHYEADPVKFMNEQIDIALSHIANTMRQMYNLQETEQVVILFKIINELITNNQIRECNQQQRASLNQQFSQQIQAVISKSQQVILESKCDKIPAILEKDNPNDYQISQNYLRNLRATELTLTNEFIQSYIKQNTKNDEYKVLKEFLDLPKFQYVSKTLKSLIYFTQQINNLFIKRFTKKNAQEITLLEALGNQPNHPLYKYYIQQIIPNWKELKEKEIEYQIGCQSHQIQQITEKTKLSDLLFTGDKQYGQFPNVLELIVNQQNNFINKIHQLVMLEKPEDFSRLQRLVQNNLIDHSSSEKDKLKELPIQNIDCSRNIMKSFDPNIYILYFLSNIEYGRGFNYLFNFRMLQEELIEQVLDGVVQINLESSQKFFFLSEINQIGLLSNNLIEQEKISEENKNRLKGLFQNKTQVYQLLQQLSTVFQMFKSEKNQANLSIDSALSQLQIKQYDNRIKQFLEDQKLIHLNDIIKCLEEMNMDELVELCNPSYQIEITEREIQPIIIFLDKAVTLINFKIALGRFILRCLSQDSDSINPKGSLFEQIFYIDIYEELWNDASNVEAQYENAMKYKVAIGQSYHLYKHIRNKLDIKKLSYQPIFQLKQEIPKNSNKNDNKMMMENFSDDTYKTNIKDKYR
ncbi:hypothetical protein ABPG74_009860 [Tetrahymena malaccensis]